MRTDELPDAVLRRAYDKLAGLFGTPKGTPDGWMWGVRAATRGWSEIELYAAVKAAAASSRYFPRPVDIVNERAVAGPPRAIDESWDRDTCPQCREAYRPGAFACNDGKVRERERCGCTMVGEGWDTGGAPVGGSVPPRLVARPISDLARALAP